MLLLRAILVLTILFLLPAIYIGFRVLDGKTHKHWRYILLGTNGVSWLIALSILLFCPSLTLQTSVLVGRFMTTLYALSLPQIAFVLVHLCLTPFKHLVGLKWRIIVYFIASSYTLFTLLYGYFIGAHDLRIERFTYTSEDLPQSFDGFRIVHFSDLHLGSFVHAPTALQQVVDAIMNESPDLIVFTGDLVNCSSNEVVPYATLLATIKAKHGVVAILGNHDYGTYNTALTTAQQANEAERIKAAIHTMGWHLLLNESKVIYADKDSNSCIYIAGTENETARIKKADAKQTWQKIPQHSFVIALTHSPEYWETLYATSAPNLTLSGHIHGYQYAPMRLDLLLDALRGTHSVGSYTNKQGATLYVSRGVGVSAIMPLRYGAWPEINVITLTKKRL